jgi:hypothetical protein
MQLNYICLAIVVLVFADYIPGREERTLTKYLSTEYILIFVNQRGLRIREITIFFKKKKDAVLLI